MFTGIQMFFLLNTDVFFVGAYLLIFNMRQVQPEMLPKNSNFSSCLQNIKLKNNTT
jgi:hypothetical protein